jgi:maltase-glucoamylase
MDGVWLDMNEITSFCDGECPDGDSDISNYSGKYDSLPYNPAGDGYSITKKTISLDAKHFVNAGEVEDNNVEYNMHSLYGSMQAKASFQFWIDATKVQGRRPFVSSKSTFAGAGKHTTHWLGDNFSQWPYLQLSVAGILDFNMFGIPLTGADVCGFHNNYEEEMCARWMQLSVFYPLARNHYNLTDNGKDPLKPQEPFRLTGKFLDAARFAIYQRYSLLRYYYTRLFEISKNGGGTLARPLFFEFPEDEGAYKGYEHSFMMGKAIKATPVLTKEDSNSGKVKSYFPAHSRFISLNDMTTIVEGGDKGTNSTLDASWTYSLLHLNEGTIIPYQAVTPDKYFSSTVNLINDYPIKLIIFPNKNGVAKGTLYIDQNGDDMNDYNLGYYQYYGFEYSNMTIRIDNLGGTGAKGTQNTGNQVLDEILVLGLKGLTPTALYGCAYDNDLNPRSVAVTYDATKGIFSIKANGADKLLFNSIQSIQFSTDAGSSTYCMPKYTITGITNVYSNDNSNDVVTKKVVQIASANNKYLPDLQATFTLLKDNLLRIQIIDPLDKTAFLAPEETFSSDYSKITSTLDISAVLTLPKQGENFYYEVHDPKSPSTILYSTKGQGFVYSQYYKRTTATVNSDDKLFGLGERVGDFFLTEGVYTLWARDEVSPIENAKRPGNNIYGVHPVYFSKLKKSTQFFAVFDHNAGAQDYILKKVGTDWTVTQVKTSGVTDQFILFNDQLSNVVRNFQELVGKPAMIPEWGLGWHQCRYGYNNTGQANSVVENYMQNDFPLDVMWTDIDYMDMYKDFTLSTTDFKDLPGNITQWRTKYGVRYIPILDAAVAYDETNDSYKNGKTKDIFIKDPNDNKKPFIGKVWPGPAVYIDWLKAGAEAYWVSEMTKLNKTLGFSGMWIDMNEASNFCNGYCSRSQKVANSVGDKLFYTPGSRDLNIKSISIDALHSDGHTEYEVHSLYGFYMCKATSKFFTDAKQRQFVITRSTYTGVGKYVSHWLGDNFSQYQYLRYSVGGIYLFGMWGVPVAGADICGFIFDTNAQLCARWYALGAFYPFSRNHNDKASVPQEPYVDMFNVAIKDGATYTYANFIREASLKRYAVHRYQYSYTHQASTDGTVYFKPLFYSYPDDPLAYNRVESNILLGDSLKLSPVVDDVSVTSFYFPDAKARWCPLYPKYFKT